MAWLVAALIDIIVTSLIAIGVSWFFVSRYLARRSNDRLGRDDVALLRGMAMILNTLLTLDDMAGEAWAMPAPVRHTIEKLLDQYNHTKESPV